mgnify:CR=1 FL=1
MTAPTDATLALVINSGSSSLKYQLLNPGSGEVVAKGLCERIGEPLGAVTHEQGGKVYPWEGVLADHGQALEEVRDLFLKAGTDLTEAGIGVVGHRLVHGGDRFSAPVRIDDEVLKAVRELAVQEARGICTAGADHAPVREAHNTIGCVGGHHAPIIISRHECHRIGVS